MLIIRTNSGVRTGVVDDGHLSPIDHVSRSLFPVLSSGVGTSIPRPVWRSSAESREPGIFFKERMVITSCTGVVSSPKTPLVSTFAKTASLAGWESEEGADDVFGLCGVVGEKGDRGEPGW